MRLIYVDEAGISNSAQEPFLVVAGVIVHADNALIHVENALNAIVEEWIPQEHRDGFVFHAKDLFNGGGKVFNRNDARWPLTRRLDLADKLAALPAQYGLTLSLGVVFKKSMTKPEGTSERDWIIFLHGVAFVGCAAVAENWMRMTCPDEVCMIIAENNDQARSLILELMRMNQDPQSISVFNDKYRHLFPFRQIKEAPLFQPKMSSNVLQLADFWAYVAKKHFMKDDRYERFTAPMWPMAAPTVWPDKGIPS